MSPKEEWERTRDEFLRLAAQAIGEGILAATEQRLLEQGYSPDEVKALKTETEAAGKAGRIPDNAWVRARSAVIAESGRQAEIEMAARDAGLSEESIEFLKSRGQWDRLIQCGKSGHS